MKRRSLPAFFLCGLYLAVLFAGFLAPASPTWQDRSLPGAPPMPFHFSGFRPYIIDSENRPRPIQFFVQGDEYRIAGILPARVHLLGIPSPGILHLLGTDNYGRDIFARLLYGGQLSLLAGLLGTVISLLIATALGGCAGYFGGPVDTLLMRVTELFLAVPWMYLLFAVRAILPLHLESGAAFLLLISIIGAVGWARPARLIRGVTLSARERGWVTASQTFGASSLWILRRHILPEATGVLLTQAAILAPQFVLAEVALSFLGLGAGEPLPSWGGMLANAAGAGLLAGQWWLLTPALALTAFCWSCFALSAALREHAAGDILRA